VAAAAGVSDVSEPSEPLPGVDGESRITAEEAGEPAWCYDDSQH